ncbi:hypothetical protein D3C73_1295640 [compost metagenome]
MNHLLIKPCRDVIFHFLPSQAEAPFEGMGISHRSGAEVLDFADPQFLITVQCQIGLINDLLLGQEEGTFLKQRFRIFRKQKFPFNFKRHVFILLADRFLYPVYHDINKCGKDLERRTSDTRLLHPAASHPRQTAWC